MKRFIWLLLGCISLITCCDEDNPTPTSGEVTITSELILEGSTYTFNGFSFEKGKVVSYNPQSTATPPDLIVTPHNSVDEVVAVLQILNNVQEKHLLGLAGEFEEWSSAKEFFMNYTQIADSVSFAVWAKPTLKNQVWIVKTLSENYGKILIKDMQAYLNLTTPYAEITFQWAYQPDGTRVFD